MNSQYYMTSNEIKKKEKMFMRIIDWTIKNLYESFGNWKIIKYRL